MKTSFVSLALIVLLFIGCSKTNNPTTPVSTSGGSMNQDNISLIADEPSSQLISSGINDFVAATYKLTAYDGDARITDLNFCVFLNNAQTPGYRLMNPYSVAQIDLRVNGIIVATAPVISDGTNAIAMFTGLKIDVPNTARGIQIEVLPHFNIIGKQGASTNNSVFLGLTYFKYLSENTVTSVDLAALKSIKYSNQFVVVAGYPTISLAQDTPIGSLGGYLGGDQTLLKFIVTNNSSATIRLRQVTLKACYSFGSGASITIEKKGVKVYDASGNLLNHNGTDVGVSDNNFSVPFDADYVISSGQSAIFSVNVNILSIGSGNSISINVGDADVALSPIASPATNCWAWNDGTTDEYLNSFLFNYLSVNGSLFVR